MRIMLSCVLIACSSNDAEVASNGSGGASTGGTGGVFPGGDSGFPGGTGGVTDAGAPEAAAGAGAQNCKTTCLGNECGFAMPDNCGGTLDCGDCGAGTDYCIKGVSEHAGDVHNAHMAIQNDYPSWFDLTDMWGANAKLLDLDAYRNELVARMNALGKVAITDPNDSAEMRVRAASANTADNFRLVTSAGYSWDNYTSTCAPAGF
jgi:hypothetical protein